jgi:acetylglutamate kinase
MQQYIDKARVLIEALPYIQQFRGETIVVKFGGSAMEDKACEQSVMGDIALMDCVGMRVAMVHGGGKAISRRMKEEGLEPRFVKGLRVTCENTVRIVQAVMNEEINPHLVRELESRGARARGVRGEDVFAVVKKEEKDAETGESLDLGYVGEPMAVDTGPVRDFLDEGIVPVVTPLGKGPDGRTYNVNADAAAAVLARALKARKLALLSDVPGLLADPKDANSLIPTLRVRDVEELVRRGVIDGGMLPKIRSGVEALQAGVKKIHLIDGRMPHSLLLEIFTDKGVGTEIIRDE